MLFIFFNIGSASGQMASYRSTVRSRVHHPVRCMGVWRVAMGDIHFGRITLSGYSSGEIVRFVEVWIQDGKTSSLSQRNVSWFHLLMFNSSSFFEIKFYVSKTWLPIPEWNTLLKEQLNHR